MCETRASVGTQETLDKARRDYWSTSRPVSEIAAELGVKSRDVAPLVGEEELPERCAICGEAITVRSRSERNGIKNLRWWRQHRGEPWPACQKCEDLDRAERRSQQEELEAKLDALADGTPRDFSFTDDEQIALESLIQRACSLGLAVAVGPGIEQKWRAFLLVPRADYDAEIGLLARFQREADSLVDLTSWAVRKLKALELLTEADELLGPD